MSSQHVIFITCYSFHYTATGSDITYCISSPSYFPLSTDGGGSGKVWKIYLWYMHDTDVCRIHTCFVSCVRMWTHT